MNRIFARMLLRPVWSGVACGAGNLRANQTLAFQSLKERQPCWSRRQKLQTFRPSLPTTPWVSSFLHSLSKTSQSSVISDSSGLLSPDDEAVGDLVEDDDDEGSSSIEEVVPPTVQTLGCSWAESVLRCVQGLLTQEQFSEFRLYSLHAKAASKSLDIRLDKTTDKYGSPNLDDISRFSRALSAILDQQLGPEEAGSLQFDVSSPGGLRALAVPQELERFRSLALEVEFVPTNEPVAAQQPAAIQRILRYIGLTASGDTRWHLHDVPFNWQAMGKKKGQKLSRKELTTEIVIPQSNVRAARFHFDLGF